MTYDFSDPDVYENVTELVDGTKVEFIGKGGDSLLFRITEPANTDYSVGCIGLMQPGYSYYFRMSHGAFSDDEEEEEVHIENGFCLKHPDLTKPEPEYFYTGPISTDGRIDVV